MPVHGVPRAALCCGGTQVPGGKFDLNNGGLLSTDCTGCGWDYPNATYDQQKAIVARHRE